MFEHLDNKIEFPELKPKNINGKRFYEHLQTNKSYPSITTVLFLSETRKVYMNGVRRLSKKSLTILLELPQTV